MKPLRLNITIPVLWLALGILSGCTHKKPVLVVPQQPPTAAAPSPSPTPEASGAQPADKAQEQQPQTQTTPSQQTKTETAQSDKTKHAKKPSPRHPVQTASDSDNPAETSRNNTGKRVIHEDAAEPPPLTTGQISPRPTPADAGQDQASTDQLLQGAESNLSGIKRTLSKEEEAMRAQIREFINQSRKATTENDLARAHILAVKARLLSDELVKQR